MLQMEEFDTDKNGTIEFDEFLEMMARQMQTSSGTEVVAEAFKVVDGDNDGFIDVDELFEILQKVSKGADKSTAEAMIAACMPKADGKIDMDEFRAVCKLVEA